MGCRVLVIDDNNFIVEIFKFYLEASQIFKEILVVNDYNEAIKILANPERKIDIVISEFHVSGSSIYNFLAQLQKRGVFTRVVIITAQYNRLIIPHLFKAGAAAYLSKKISSDYFIEVVRLVMKNDYYLSAEQFSVFKSNYSLEVQEEQNAFLEVSERDIQLIYLMANQLTAKEISDRLCVSVKSVEAYKN